MKVREETIKLKREEVYKNIFEDKILNFKEKGMMCYMLSFGENKIFTQDDFIPLTAEHHQAIRAGTNKLEKNGYIIVVERKVIIRWPRPHTTGRHAWVINYGKFIPSKE